ncbi:hypothetical protein [Bosea thiooxidans]
MATKFRIAGLLAVTLILTGVALAQQSRGLDAAGDETAIAARSEKLERLRVPRPVRSQFAAAEADCRADVCNAPPKQPDAAAVVPVADACSSLGAARDRNGRPIRRLCAFN